VTTETITFEAQTAPPSRGWRYGFLGFIVAVAFVAVLAAGFMAGLAVAYQSRAMPGVDVAGVSVAGMDRATAEAALRASLPALGDGQITVTVDGEPVALPYDSVARDYDLEAMLDAAFAVGRGGTLAEQSLDRVRSLIRGTSVRPIAEYDRDLARSRLMVIAVDKARDPVDASVSLPEGSAFFQTQPAVDGRTIDVDATLAAIDPLLAATDAGGATVAAVTQPVEPELTTAEAEAAATRASLLTAADIAVTSGKKRFTISNESLRSWVTFQAGPDGALVAAVDAKKLEKVVKGFAKKVDQAGTNARFRMSIGRGGRPTTIIASKPGRATDVAASVAAIQASLASPPANGLPTAELVVTSSQPAFTTEDAKVWKGKLKPIGRARWTTHFPQGDHNFNGKNIFIPAGLIDGYVVPPGGWFDFWTVVGEISRARGFGLGGAIINGHTQPQGALGGGICSCSTTLFNAALRYGLEMGDRRNHYYYITRYPLGLDATVFKSGGGSVQSMSFRNDTDSPILIHSWHSFGIINFQLWSVDSGRRVSFTRPTVRNVRPATTVVQYTSSLRRGARKQIEFPAAGKDVWVTRTVRDRHGKVISRTTFYSHYARVDGIILVGRSSAASAQ
jgi:vancomycin resistance protein YoaR